MLALDSFSTSAMSDPVFLSSLIEVKLPGSHDSIKLAKVSRQPREVKTHRLPTNTTHRQRALIVRLPTVNKDTDTSANLKRSSTDGTFTLPKASTEVKSDGPITINKVFGAALENLAPFDPSKYGAKKQMAKLAKSAHQNKPSSLEKGSTSEQPKRETMTQLVTSTKSAAPTNPVDDIPASSSTNSFTFDPSKYGVTKQLARLAKTAKPTTSAGLEQKTTFGPSRHGEKDTAKVVNKSGQTTKSVDSTKTAESHPSGTATKTVKRTVWLDTYTPGHGVQAVESTEPLRPNCTVEPILPISPIKPVKRTKWTESYTPGKGVEPIRPTAPAKLTKSAESVEPILPISPIKPVKRTKWTESYTPGKGVEPVRPTAPANTTKSADPVQAILPASPIKPVKRTKWTESYTPGKGVEPVRPTAPAETTKSPELVESVIPTSPVRTVKRTKWTESYTPGKGVEPVESAAPVKPTRAFEPITPVIPTWSLKRMNWIETCNPGKGVEPVDPTELDEPVVAMEPAAPGKPTARVKRSSRAKKTGAAESTSPVDPNGTTKRETWTDYFKPGKEVEPIQPNAPVELTAHVEPTRTVVSTFDIPDTTIGSIVLKWLDTSTLGKGVEPVESTELVRPTSAAEPGKMVEPIRSIIEDKHSAEDMQVIESFAITPSLDSVQSMKSTQIVKPTDNVEGAGFVGINHSVKNSIIVAPVNAVDRSRCVEIKQSIEESQSAESSQIVENIAAVDRITSVEAKQSIEESQSAELSRIAENVDAVEPTKLVEPIDAEENVSPSSQEFVPGPTHNTPLDPSRHGVKPSTPSLQSIKTITLVEPANMIGQMLKIGLQQRATSGPSKSGLKSSCEDPKGKAKAKQKTHDDYIEDDEYWQFYTDPTKEAKDTPEWLAERDARRSEAMKVKESLAKGNKRQRILPVPQEILTQIVLDLDHGSRRNLALTCRDAFESISAVTCIWDLEAGELYGADQGEKIHLHPGVLEPATRHSLTVVSGNYNNDGYMGHDLSMIQKMTVGLWNVGDRIRRLEFHGVPLLSWELLHMIVPRLPRLEYLGVFHCRLIHIGHTLKLLTTIRTGNYRDTGERSYRVQLDFYPSIDCLEWSDVHLREFLPAFLVRVLNAARKQGAHLMDKGSAFSKFIARSNCRLPPMFLQHCEWRHQDMDAVRFYTQRARAGPSREVKETDLEARYFICRRCKGLLRGCFFPYDQVQHYADRPECYGCILKTEIRNVANHINKDMIEYADSWVDNCWSFRVAVEKARLAPEVVRAEDKTYGQWYLEKLETEHRERLIRQGKVRPGTTRIPGRYNFVKIKACKFK
ncbi:MAG: hypothetical protein M1825_005633 [Sarcosagium campestre]|nr:MAG: hypothetical protein M1825_005633 [Sarcosagium campestre]